MVWTGARKLILPAALTVTTFAVAGAVISCGGSSAPKKTSSAVACKTLPSNACQKCTNTQGSVVCGPSSNCYDANGGCAYGSSG